MRRDGHLGHLLGAPVRAVTTAVTTAAQSFGRGYRTVVVSGRWFVVVGWIAATLLATFALPSDAGRGSNNLGELLPAGSPAVAVEQRSLSQFQVPVLSETTVVVHDPGGLSMLTLADINLWAASHVQAYLRGAVPKGQGQVVAAVPIPTSSRQTAATYLYVSNRTSLQRTTALAKQYAAHFHNQGSVRTYVTGIAPAQVRQAYYLTSRLTMFELATLLLIAVVVAITFRSLVAPLAVLFVAGLGYLIAVRLLGVLAVVFGFALPDQLQPLIAALLLGVVTDYCVLFFSGFRQQLQRGLPRHEAARRTAITDGPIIAVAGITVAGGTAALLAAKLDLFRAFGPALSLTVLVGLLVSLTLVPALMAILGHRLFLSWHGTGTVAPVVPGSSREAGRLIRIVADRRGARAATLVCMGLLLLSAAPLLDMRLDLSFTSGLPVDDPVQQGARVLDSAGIRGVTAPTEVLVEGRRITAQRAALDRLQHEIERQPGVAEVLGPAQNPLPDDYGIVFSRDGNTARYVVVLDSDPLAAGAIAHLRQLTHRLQGGDGLAARAGVHDALVAVTGQTAIAAELGTLTQANLRLTLLAALAVEFVLLAAYLRAIPAPIVLLGCSALGVAAALGLTVLVFQGLRSDPGLTFYAPFATAVLLLALGSDYNVFAVGSIWTEASRHPLSEAIARAMPGTARAISAAGIILASTFAMIALIPLETFRQIAFTMAAGLLIDTFLVRPVLTPAVLTLLGRFGSWPSRRIRTAARSHRELQDAVSSAAAVATDAAPTGEGSRR